MAGTPPCVANSSSSLASGSLHAQPAPGDSDVSRGAAAWVGVGSAVTLATVARPADRGRDAQVIRLQVTKTCDARRCCFTAATNASG